MFFKGLLDGIGFSFLVTLTRGAGTENDWLFLGCRTVFLWILDRWFLFALDFVVFHWIWSSKITASVP